MDAQLPRRLARWLTANGHDAVHTLDLPDGNRTSDGALAHLADAEDRILATKDADFVRSHLLAATPRRLWLVSTGNMPNAVLERIVADHLGHLDDLFTGASFVEMTTTALVVHA